MNTEFESVLCSTLICDFGDDREGFERLKYCRIRKPSASKYFEAFVVQRIINLGFIV